MYALSQLLFFTNSSFSIVTFLISTPSILIKFVTLSGKKLRKMPHMKIRSTMENMQFFSKVSVHLYLLNNL
jgi:hypothetical protein